MKQYQNRVLKELQDISSNLLRLEEFLASKDYVGLNTLERQLLEAQKHAMLSYKTTLQMRIEHWPKE